ncbi:MAG: acetolactate synthase large subunit [Opitutales bacterium]
MKLNGAELTIRLLERQGIETIAGLPGGANLPLYDALAQRGTIHHVLARHEQGAGFIAQGMARATGKAAVCLVTSGPGATNAITAVADAKLDSIPLVCISGQVPSQLIGTDAFQEIDVFGLSLPITKQNYLVQSVEELLRIIPEAFMLAQSGRPGPVWIDIPKDIQKAEIEIADDAWPAPGVRAATEPPAASALDAAAHMIEKAERPIIYLGGGIIHGEASEAARALIEKTDAPCVTTLMAIGSIPTDHPANLGMLGMHAAPYTNLALEECDLLVALGARFDDRATGRVNAFCPHARVLHVDIDASELGKIRQPTLGIVADVRETLDALLPRLEERIRPEWQARIQILRTENPMAFPGEDDLGMPYGIVRAVAEAAGEDAFVTTDVGQHQMFAAQAYPFRWPRQWLTSGGLGTMGFGVPAAIGAALASPGRTAVCISGDGSFLMNNQELITAVEEGAKVKIVLMNNQSLGLVHQQQTLFFGKRLMASEFRHGPDFCMMARSMGVPAIDLADTPHPRAALAAALAAPGPALIHAPVDVRDHVLPMVPPGGANAEMIRHAASVEASLVHV